METLGDRRISICRELTKKFEEVVPTTLTEAVRLYETEKPRGEYVLVIEGKSKAIRQMEEEQSWQTLSLEEHMQYYEDQGIERKEAMKQVAKDRGVSRRDIYQQLFVKEDKEV